MLRTCDEGIIMVYTYQMTVERRVRDEAETERVVKGHPTYLGDSSPCSHQVLSNRYVPNTRRGKVKEQRCKGGNATLDATCDALITCTTAVCGNNVVRTPTTRARDRRDKIEKFRNSVLA